MLYTLSTYFSISNPVLCKIVTLASLLSLFIVVLIALFDITILLSSDASWVTEQGIYKFTSAFASNSL